MKNELTYLACPYTHPNHDVMVERWNAVNKAAAKLMAEGRFIFSPISHTHPIAEEGELPRGWEYWEGYDRRMLKNCDRITVLRLDGWKESKGVQAEIQIGKEFGIPVDYIDP